MHGRRLLKGFVGHFTLGRRLSTFFGSSRYHNQLEQKCHSEAAVSKVVEAVEVVRMTSVAAFLSSQGAGFRGGRPGGNFQQGPPAEVLGRSRWLLELQYPYTTLRNG